MSSAIFRVHQGRAQLAVDGSAWQSLPLGLGHQAAQAHAAAALNGATQLAWEDLDESHRWAINVGLANGVAMALAAQAKSPAAAPKPSAPPSGRRPFHQADRLFQYQRTVSMRGAQHPESRLQLKRLMEALPPVAHAQITEARSRGEAWHRATTSFETLLLPGADPKALEAALAAHQLQVPEPIRKSFLEHLTRLLHRHLRVDARLSLGEAPVALRPTEVNHQLEALPPSAGYLVVVDETGTFPAALGDALPKGEGPGGVVAVVFPAEVAHQMPEPPKGWHAFERATDAEWDRWLQAILDRPVGVLGFSVGEVQRAQCEAWLLAVMRLVRQVLWRLPLQGPTELTVLVEQRGTHQDGDAWRSAAAALLAEAAALWPERWGQVALEMRVVAKDGHPLMPYADVVAYTWGAKNRERLRISGLEVGCLGGATPPGSAALLNGGLGEGGHPWPSAWARMVADPYAHASHGLVADSLGLAQLRAQQDPSYLDALHQEVRRHLESKAVDVVVLGKQVAALKALGGEGLGLVGRLATEAAALESRNHRGVVNVAQLADLERLAEAVLDEHPSLACQVALNVAVRHLNRFDWGAAEAALAFWAHQAPRVPGLLHWGRVQSSLAQCAAFRGQWGLARGLAGAAIQAFSRLSDAKQAEGEAQQSRCYLALATLDDPLSSAGQRVDALTAVLGPLDAAIARLAPSTEPATKYHHHLLVRFLAEHGGPSHRQAYLDALGDAAWGIGHPWPAILMHQSRLLRAAGRHEAAAKRLAQARALAQNEPGFLLQLMALAYHRLGHLWGYWPEVSPEGSTLEARQDALPLAPAVLWECWQDESALHQALPFYIR